MLTPISAFAVATPMRPPRSLREPREGEILEQVVADRGVPADRFVELPREEHELPVRERPRRRRAVRTIEREDPQQPERGRRLQHPFEPRARVESPDEAEQPAAARDRGGEGRPDQLRRELDVRIAEEEPVAGRDFAPTHAAWHLPAQSSGQRSFSTIFTRGSSPTACAGCRACDRCSDRARRRPRARRDPARAAPLRSRRSPAPRCAPARSR